MKNNAEGSGALLQIEISPVWRFKAIAPPSRPPCSTAGRITSRSYSWENSRWDSVRPGLFAWRDSLSPAFPREFLVTSSILCPEATERNENKERNKITLMWFISCNPAHSGQENNFHDPLPFFPHGTGSFVILSDGPHFFTHGHFLLSRVHGQ